jgi:tetratricopeptide (TPR) repeat protein
VNWHFTQHRYELFDWLASVVEPPAVFERASPAGRCRWLYTVGFAHYQVGKRTSAESAWQRALALAEAQPLEAMRRMVAMAMLRLLLDSGRLDEAAALEATLSTQGGAGRLTQLIELQTMRARGQLLRGEAARALATVDEALALARQGGLTLTEQAALHTDWSQALIALERLDEAEALLARLAAQHGGRDAQVLHCLLLLLRALHPPQRGEGERRHALAEGLRLAQSLRYTMFFRLLPARAGQVCALALRWNLAPVFVTEVVRERDLPAPADADAQWPWALWLRMLGGFELQLHGQRQQRSGKIGRAHV